MNGDDEKEVFVSMEGLILALKRLRERTVAETRIRQFSVVITLMEQATSYFALYILGAQVYGNVKKES